MRRFAPALRPPVAFNFDRAAGRFLVYPARALRQRGRFDFYHVVDHTYAQLVHVLPPERTGVFCHDLDAFRCLLRFGGEKRPQWFRSMQRVALLGMQRAAIVFYSTDVVRSQIEREGFVHPERLVQAPYGISPEFDAVPRADDGAAQVLEPLEGRPYLLHVGSAVPRKRLDVLFETFARLRAKHPELRLVQNGAALSDAQRAHVARLGIEGALMQPSKRRIERSVLAGLYRRAKAVLVTSDAEGFGIPVIEGLACGAPVFASDIPVLREVSGGAAVHCRVGDPDDWAARIDRFLCGEPSPPLEARLARAALYTWQRHAEIILDAYERLGRSDRARSHSAAETRSEWNATC
jgi:glycosyltransferase involved in cell wall biosynthesis